jgi:hypothetical protein
MINNRTEEAEIIFARLLFPLSHRRLIYKRVQTPGERQISARDCQRRNLTI